MAEHETDTPIPTPGRILIAHGVDPLRNNGGVTAPAIVVRVFPQTFDGVTYVNVRVFTDGPDAPLWWTSVKIYPTNEAAILDGALRWLTWPARD